MRFLIINTDYALFIDWLYLHHPGLSRSTYAVQYQARMRTLFGMADFYSSALSELGHEAWDVVANIEPMQRQWAREQGMPDPGPSESWSFRLRRGFAPWPFRKRALDWLYRVLEAQIRAYRPDVLYSMAIETIGSDFLRSMKGYYKVAVAQHAAPYIGYDVREYDLIVSSLPNLVRYYREQGMKAEYLRLGFDPRVLGQLLRREQQYDIAFVGGLTGHHGGGSECLEQLCGRNDARIWGYDREKIPPGSRLRSAHRGAIFGVDMFQALRDARMVFNRHIDVAQNYANNMRLFEATGGRAFAAH